MHSNVNCLCICVSENCITKSFDNIVIRENLTVSCFKYYKKIYNIY